MIIKSYTAESAGAAMKMVRRELGGDAIVLKTRQYANGGKRPQVEITACVERADSARVASVLRADGLRESEPQESTVPTEPVPRPSTMTEAAEPDPTMPTITAPIQAVALDNVREVVAALERKMDQLLGLNLFLGKDATRPRQIQQVAEQLRRADFSEVFVTELVTSLVRKYANPTDVKSNLTVELARALERYISPGIDVACGDRILFTGPPGSGKTSVMGKMAAQLVCQQKKKVKLAAFDCQSIAAYEELAWYADLLDLDMPDSCVDGNLDNGDKNVVTLIDAPALPTERSKRLAFQETVHRLRTTHRIVVFSALTRSSDVRNQAASLTMLAPTQAVMTMLDQTHRLGSIADVARTLKAPVAYTSQSPAGTGELEIPSAQRLAETMLAPEVSHGQ